MQGSVGGAKSQVSQSNNCFMALQANTLPDRHGLALKTMWRGVSNIHHRTAKGKETEKTDVGGAEKEETTEL